MTSGSIYVLLPSFYRDRSKPLSKSLWAFLPPHLPIQEDVFRFSNDVDSKLDSTRLPSDEQLAHRTLLKTFIIVCFSTIVGLAGGLPLYLVQTPCIAHVLRNNPFGGRFSTMQDLSLFRLLDLQDNNLPTRPKIQIRLIILAVMVVAVVAIPSILKFLHEFNRIVVYHRQWLGIRCGGMEMAWLSLGDARGFAGWSENTLKDYLVKVGLSQGFKVNDGNQSNVMTSDFVQESLVGRKDHVQFEIDIQNLFSVVYVFRL